MPAGLWSIELGGDLVASLLREQDVATHIRDEECPDVDAVDALGLAWERPTPTCHR
jgi:hypothetical protein